MEIQIKKKRREKKANTNKNKQTNKQNQQTNIKNKNIYLESIPSASNYYNAFLTLFYFLVSSL